MQAALHNIDGRILNSINQAVIVTDLSGMVTHWNRGAEKLYLWFEAEAIDRNIVDLLLTGPSTAEGEEIMDRLRKGESWTGDLEVRRKDGQVVSIEVTNSPIYDDAERLTGILGISHDIAHRKRAEQSLIDSEIKYRSLIEHASDGIHTYDPNGRFIDTNAKMCEMLGYTRAELQELRVQDLVPHEDLVEDPIRFDALLAGETLLRERRLRRKDGSIFIAEISGRMIQKNVLQASIRDVSERKKTQAVLIAQKQALEMVATDVPLDAVLVYLAEVVESLSDGTVIASILLLDGDGRLWNGASPSLPEHYIKAIAGLRADVNVGTCCSAAASGKPVITRDIANDPKWQSYAALPLGLGLKAAWTLPILARDGRVMGTFGTYFRTTREPDKFEIQVVEILARTAGLAIERTEADEKLKEGEERLRTIFEASHDGIVVEDSETIVYVNRSYLCQFGYDEASELVGRNISSVVAEEDRARVMGYGRYRLVGNDIPSQYEFKGRRKGGDSIDIEASVSTSKASGRRYTTTISRDVTERNRIQNALRHSENQLRLVTDAIPLLVSFVDAEERFRFVNRTYALWYGKAESAILGDRVENVMGTSAYEALRPDIETALKGVDVTFERLIDCDGREKCVRVNFVPQKDDVTGAVSGFYSFIWDISDIKAVETELERSKNELEDRVISRTRDLERANEARVHMLHQLVTAQEDERRRMARELHDQLGQQMTVLRLQLQAIRTAATDPAELRRHLDELYGTAKQLDSDIDFLAWKFRPAVLDDLGIVAALEQYVDRWSANFGIEARFDATRFGDTRLSSEVETSYYRVTQEALTNVCKHAKASQVNVFLEPLDDGTVLIIEDDGIGFESNSQFAANKGMGLIGMAERAALIGGSLEIESNEGSGTTIFVRVPEKAYADRE